MGNDYVIEGQKVLLLDAMELTGQWDLKSQKFDKIALLSEYRVAIPAVVFEEVVGNHGRQVEALLRTFPASNDKMSKLGLPKFHHGEGSRPYRYRLETCLLRVGVEVLPWPDASHETVARRAVDRIPPFNEKGGGYRDTLVWMTAIQLAREGKSVFLATKDGAFYEKNELHPALKKEVAVLDGAVEVICDLERWVDEQELKTSLVQISEDEIESMLDQFYGSYLGPWGFEDVWLSPDECGFGLQAGESSLSGVVGPRMTKVTCARRRPDGGAYVEVVLDDYFELTSNVSLLPPVWEISASGVRSLAPQPDGFDVTSIVRLDVLFKLTFNEPGLSDEGGAEGEDEEDDGSSGDSFFVEWVEFSAHSSGKPIILD